MPTENTKVECDLHGSGAATYVCQHLASGEGRAFAWVTIPRIPWRFTQTLGVTPAKRDDPMKFGGHRFRRRQGLGQGLGVRWL